MLTAAGARCPLAGAPVVEISGEVAHPGRYPLVGDTTLRGAILSAGGVTRLASLHGARVARCGHRIVVDLDAVGDGKAADPALLPGDLVEIPGRED
jgi:protein involved in polysaccharide export with SLBB domain